MTSLLISCLLSQLLFADQAMRRFNVDNVIAKIK